MTPNFMRRRVAPLALLPLIAALPARAQLLPRPEILPQPSVPTTAAPLSFEEIFAGVNPAPLSLKTTDLKGEWRLVTIKMRSDVDSATLAATPSGGREDSFLVSLRQALGAAPGQFITQGQTVAGGGELFLVAYHMNLDPTDFQRTMEADERAHPRTQPPSPAEINALLESYARARPLELSLINVKLLGELSGVRAFNAELQSAAIRELVQTLSAEHGASAPPGTATPATPSGIVDTPATVAPKAPSTLQKPPTPGANLAARNFMSLNNLKQLGLALVQYASDHDEVLPPMGTPAQAKAALSPYTQNASIWRRADSGEAYVPNPMLSGRKTGHISNPQEFVAFYEANPAPDGTRGVVFLNGGARRLTQAEWPRAKKASKLR